MIAVVGSNGLIGNYLNKIVNPTHEFNSSNITSINNYEFDIVYLAAPSGNRIKANTDAKNDYDNVRWLYSNISQTKIKRLVIIGTIDSVLRPHLPYGSNRLWLEQKLSGIFKTNILRLSSLIHSTITKNVLYDLKYSQYLDQINLNARIQWYNLENLAEDINFSITSDVTERNLISEPISNREIVNNFFPHLTLNEKETINQSIEPWCYSKEEIFTAMEKYLNE